ncbi:MAG TPA: response regulator transcription factor [Polyangiaceae bacterium]|nr:response regulator transcription factor [Polyangiaceae bacterium]
MLSGSWVSFVTNVPVVAPSPAFGAPRLLVVETGDLIERTFAGQGYGLTRVVGRGEALATVTRLRPAAVVVHLEPQQDNDASFVRALARATIAPVLLVTSRSSERRIVDLLKAEAAGLLFEEDVPARLVGSIPDLVKGATPLSNDVSHLVMARARRHSSQLIATAEVARRVPPSALLAGRKREILGMLAKGLSYDQIGVALDISVNTVRSHVREIYATLEVTSKVEAVMVGLELGLIESK